MKIETSRSPLARIGRRSGAAGAGSRIGDGFAELLAGDETSEAISTPAKAATTPSSALLSIQELNEEQPAPRRRKPRAAATEILDQLEKLRLAVLTGTLDRATLEQLKTATALEIDRAADPMIADIVAEIELRAAVELAKYDAAIGKK